MPTAGARALLTSLVDYAGLYPPASLTVTNAAEHYARARAGTHAWMLARLVVPASRLPELSEAAAVLMPGTHATSGYREHAHSQSPWPLSVVIDRPLDEALDLIDAFDERHAEPDRGLASVESVELKAARPDDIDEALDILPSTLFPFFEIPLGGDCRGFVAALAGGEASAKIRCGGTAPGTIPDTGSIAAFLRACRGAGVSFKATAGLHHPVRGEQPLTYEPGCPRDVMHGFINLFVAAGLAQTSDEGEAVLREVLDERDGQAFEVSNTGVVWRGHPLATDDIVRAREAFALSIGSCSFDEPVDDLRSLGWL